MKIELSVKEAQEIIAEALKKKLGIEIDIKIDTDIEGNIEITGKEFVL
jgi:hypothetical protein